MKLLLPEALRAELEARVRAAAPGADLAWYDDHARPDQDVSDVDVLMRWWFDAQTLNGLVEQLPSLRWLHIPRAGVDNSLVSAVMARDILITNSAGIHAAPIAEFVMLYVLDHAKQAGLLRSSQAERRWVGRQVQLAELTDKLMLIIGLGQIGQAIAARAAAFGMRVVGSRRSGAPVPGVSRVLADGAWRQMLGEADYVVIAAPLTPQTRGMFGAAELAAMRPDAYLINIARGEIVDEAALIDALGRGQIAGAGLDVFSTEPLPAEHPLWGLPNVFVTPHVSWLSPEIRPRTISLFVENVRRYAAGEPLRNIVDKHAGY
ncbi:D-2-hydroxyacid dehydrogenase [Oscillochloris sp. ZM17-4]|uniref:D-2-hydroxyacid dehydrogenase n=1 Tax=Oscillochloris sp. ZM17-4 TaxID=2866714 RepID=UPI001C732F0B|nr:D-2-hydroxyacid dehydrogenase [Oscillochloris sp. ZM17-4]MBX0326079.1 D-2-hydroxyacid dehydrogenase [Oscillochloris sp. ZM17-4]